MRAGWAASPVYLGVWCGGGKVIGSFQETRCRGERGEGRQMRREEEDARFLGKFHQRDLETSREKLAATVASSVKLCIE